MKTLTQICEDFKISKHVKAVKGPELNLWNDNKLNTYSDMVNFYDFSFETETEVFPPISIILTAIGYLFSLLGESLILSIFFPYDNIISFFGIFVKYLLF